MFGRTSDTIGPVKRRVLYLFSSCFCALALLASPLPAVAEGVAVLDEETAVSPIIITELQTGATTASDEFVELYNQSDQPVDITGWQVRFVNSSTTSTATTLLATITPTTSDSVIIEPGQHFVLHTASVVAAPGTKTQQFSAGLSKTDKTVALFARDETTCRMVVQDALAWESTPATTRGEGLGVVIGSAQTSKEKLFHRYRNSAGAYVDTNHNVHDFVLSTIYTSASPGSDNLVLFSGTPGPIGEHSALEAFDAPDCTVPDPDPGSPDPDPASPPSIEDPEPDPLPEQPIIPAENVGLKAPQLSELLPNPASPKTDADDEFIELYNPNERQFNLSGYVLEVGTTTKRRYVFPAGTSLPAKSFVAFFSADTKLALSNAGGQVRLLDPLGRVLVVSEAYTSAKDNQAWILANGTWQWTTKPTPNAINVVSAPEAKKKSASKTAAVKNASSDKSNAKSASDDSQDDQAVVAATTSTGTPLHPGVLALITASAVLYGAYEYRHDIANKIRQFRNYRATRRQNRQGA